MDRPPQNERVYDLSEAREKIAAYCAYRERSQVEVRRKLTAYGLLPETCEHLITELIQGNFLNEERFARAYARGKFRMKGWGKLKIKQGLKQHQIGDYLLRRAFSEIDPDAYEERLQELTEKYWQKAGGLNDYQRRGKVAGQLIRKGYESDLVWAALERFRDT